MSVAAAPVTVGIVNESARITADAIARIAAAMQQQVSRDFHPYWKAQANIAFFARAIDAPADAWLVRVQDDIHEPGAAGFHTDENHEPYSLVQATGNLDDDSMTISHEILEMLADPWGNFKRSAKAMGHSEVGAEHWRYLVEVCDPCEANEYGYRINGILVSDFLLPGYYYSVHRKGHPCDFMGAIAKPRTLLPGGYISYQKAGSHWFQQTWFGGEKPSERELGRVPASAHSIRAWVDRHTAEASTQAMRAR